MDGQPHFLIGVFGMFATGQKRPITPEDRELVRKKVVPFCLKNYIEVESLISLIHYFYLKKAVHDVMMVYNGTGCGLNDRIWAPHFRLPTVRHTLRSLLPGYLQCNLDIREMFLNFLLNDTTKEMSEVDIKHVRSKSISDLEWERGRPNGWERWCHNWTGLRILSYRSIQLLIYLKIETYGDRWDRSNPFHCERVVYNLPGTKGYQPGLLWVMKVRFNGHLACEVYICVDDGRVTVNCAGQ